jgi:hypothetical protein
MEGRVRLLEAHICVAPQCVNRVFCTYVAIPGSAAWPPLGVPAQSLDKKKPFPFKG